MRCKVGDLCVIINDAQGDNGKQVVVLSQTPPIGEVFSLPDGAAWVVGVRKDWFVESLSGPLATNAEPCVYFLIDDCNLLPITPDESITREAGREVEA